MREIEAVFFDVGGVVLTNGWDEHARLRAAAQFQLDRADLETRHERVVTDFETGRLTLDDYLGQVVFWTPRSFTREAFRSFMFACSQPHPEILALLATIKRSRGYLMATLNNESPELNAYRIESFGLRKYFDLFLSSCYVGVRKPSAAIFQLALQITQRDPGECVFVDDRTENVEAARRSGMHAIQYRHAEQLAADLRSAGVRVASS